MKDRKNCCPKCQSKLLARYGDCIICLASGCNWAVQAKREEDKSMKTVAEVSGDFND